MAKDSVIYVANTTGFAVLPDGTEFFFRAGSTKVRADHPVMKACPRNFEPLDASVGVVDYVKKP
jgi:hypothetical protein